MSVLVSITKCMFCDGYVPASYDDVYIKHMNDHHRAFVNIKFLFKVSLLSDDELDSFIAGTPKITREITEEDVKVEIADNFIDIEDSINPTVSLEVVPDPKEELEIDEDEDEPINPSDSLEVVCVPKQELKIDDLKDDFSKPISKKKKKKLKANNKKIKKKETGKSSNDPRNESFECDICAHYVAKNQYALTYHKKHYHDKTLKICETCGKTVIGIRRYQKHLEIHKDKVECPECKKVVRRLSRHLIIVHAVKQFSCETCEKKFHNEKSLQNHLVVHSDERPFKCRYGCDYASKASGNRTKHEIQKHNAKSELDTKAKIKSGELIIGHDIQV